MTTIVVFNLFYHQVKSELLRTKCMFKHQELQMIGLKVNKINMSNVHLLEVVDRGSETELQVGE